MLLGNLLISFIISLKAATTHLECEPAFPKTYKHNEKENHFLSCLFESCCNSNIVLKMKVSWIIFVLTEPHLVV